MNWKTNIAAGAALAIGMTGPALAGKIKFDPAGTGGAGGFLLTDTFDWAPSNILLQDLYPAPVSPTGIVQKPFTVLSQGVLGSWLRDNVVVGAPSGVEFTYVMSVPSLGNLVTSVPGVIEVANHNSGVGPIGFFDVYVSAPDSDDNLGTGFANGTNILHGAITSGGGGLTLDLCGAPTPGGACVAGGLVGPLDNKTADGDNLPGVLTQKVSSASLSYSIDVLSQDSSYFLTDVTADLLGMDIDFTGGGNTPFDKTNPSKLVAGSVPNYGTDGHNDNTCGASPSCDFHYQVDAATGFAVNVPEPASLALLGVGLLGLGGLQRRRRSRA